MTNGKNKETILVTGASGFIGGWLVETLFLEGKCDVRAGIRSWSSATRLARFPMDIVLCDVMDKKLIAEAMDGVSTVIHCATGTQEVIVQGTQNMLDIAAEHKVKRFIFMSSTAVYGNATGNIDETFPCMSMGWEYGDAKIEAEKRCWEAYGKGLPLTIIRPPIVYGPFSQDWVVRFAQKLKSGNWGILEKYGDGLCNMLYVSDAVSGILKAARSENAIGQVLNISGPEVITWNEYSKRFNTALGLPELKRINPSRSKVRAAVMQSVKNSAKIVLKYFETPLKKLYERSPFARSIMQFVENKIKTTASFSELRSYNRHGVILTAKARKLIGYVPAVDVNKGLELSVAWLRHLGAA